MYKIRRCGSLAGVWRVELEDTENSKAGDGFLPNKEHHDPVLEIQLGILNHRQRKRMSQSSIGRPTLDRLTFSILRARQATRSLARSRLGQLCFFII